MPSTEPERKTQESEQIVVEVVRIKLSSSILTKKSDRKYILSRTEADYGRAKKYKTNENKLQAGAGCLVLPVGLWHIYLGLPSRPRWNTLLIS